MTISYPNHKWSLVAPVMDRGLAIMRSSNASPHQELLTDRIIPLGDDLRLHSFKPYIDENAREMRHDHQIVKSEMGYRMELNI